MQHILIVEDDPHIANGIQFNLEAEGFFVTTVAEGPQALAVFAQHPGEIDLIVLDLMLPGMSGYAVCEEVRRRDVDIPILILSAHAHGGPRPRLQRGRGCVFAKAVRPGRTIEHRSQPAVATKAEGRRGRA